MAGSMAFWVMPSTRPWLYTCCARPVNAGSFKRFLMPSKRFVPRLLTTVAIPSLIVVQIMLSTR